MSGNKLFDKTKQILTLLELEIKIISCFNFRKKEQIPLLF